MNKRNLMIVAVLAVVVVVSVLLVLFGIKIKAQQDMQGKLVFAATYDQGLAVNRIVIESSDGITELQQKDSYWLIKEKGGYYADFSLIHRFLTAVNKSAYVVKLPYNEKLLRDKYLFMPEEDKDNAGLLIRTYAGDRMLDEIIVGLPDDEERYFFARQPKSKNIWLIDGNFNLPLTAKHWLPRPILSIPQKAIESVTIGKDYVQRLSQDGVFYNPQNMFVEIGPLQKLLSGIRAIDVMTAEDFKKSEWQKAPEKVIDVITFYGLEFIFKLYSKDDRYWLQINLSTTPLPIAAANDYIRDNRFLYEGWVFELDSEQGRLMNLFNLM